MKLGPNPTTNLNPVVDSQPEFPVPELYSKDCTEVSTRRTFRFLRLYFCLQTCRRRIPDDSPAPALFHKHFHQRSRHQLPISLKVVLLHPPNLAD